MGKWGVIEGSYILDPQKSNCFAELAMRGEFIPETPVGISMLIVTNNDWGLIILMPGLFLRKDLFNRELNLKFIKQHKFFSYSIIVYMALGSLALLFISLSKAAQSVYGYVDFKKLTYFYLMPAFILFAIYDYWLLKMYRNT